MKTTSMHWLAMVVSSGLFGLGCGSSSTPDGASSRAVTGLAAADSAVTTVSIRDSSSPAVVRSTSPDIAGSFVFDTTEMRPPFFLKAQAGSRAEYAIAFGGGTANVNPVTTAACAGSSENVESEDCEDGWSGKDSHASENALEIMKKLNKVLKPLFDLYGITHIGEDSGDGNGSNVRALLRDVSFKVKKGVVTVTNKATGGIIFTGPLRHLSEGTFFPENMPAGPGGGTTCTSFTYGPFGACQPDGTQTRTVLTSSPTGCTGGTPVLTQACTYVPTCTLATAVPSCTACHGLPPTSHTGRPDTCATCHGPVNNGTGMPSSGMGASLSGTNCALTYPVGGTHDNGVVNLGAAQ